MPLTAEEERRYQRLGAKYGLFDNVEAPTEDYGTGGFAGRTAANILPGALEKLINTPEGILNMGVPEEFQTPLTQVPDFFNVRAPQSIPEHVIGGAGEIAEYLPAIIGSQAMATKGLMGLGMGARAAKIGGAGVGFGMPMSPHGAETAGIQGGVGALQTAAMDWGWRGKVAAGLIGGGAGYYEGAKGPHGTPTQGAIFGALNLLGPTVIDPIVNKLTGYKPGMQPDPNPVPGQPYGPEPHPGILQTGRAGLPFGIDDAQAAAQQTVGAGAPYDAFAGLQRTSDMRLNHGANPAPSGLPWYETADPLDLKLAGANAEGVLPRAADPIARSRRGDYPGVPRANLTELPPAQAPEAPGLFPMMDEVGEENIFQHGYGRGTNAYDLFGERGVQSSPILSQGETFPGGGLFPEAPLTPREQIVLSQSRRGQQGTRAAENVGTDHLSPNERAVKEGRVWNNPDQSTPYVRGVSPHPGLDFDTLGTGSEFAYGRGTDPYDLFAGVQKPPIMSQGETFPGGGLFPQAPLSPREQIVQSAMRAGRDMPKPAKAEPLPSESAAAPAAAAPKKVPVKNIRPSIDIDGTRVFGKYGDTHQDIFDRWKVGKSEDDVVLALMDFDTKENPNYFIDKGGNRLSREQLQEMHGIRDSQKLREAQGWKPPKTKPVEPAPAAAGNVAPKAADVVPEPAPVQPATPPVDARPKVRVRGKYPGEWNDAVVVGKDGKVLHVEIEDPIFGKRETTVMESETLPALADLQTPETPKSGVPFKDVESVKLERKEGFKEIGREGEEGPALFSPDVSESSGPSRTKMTLKGRQKTVLEIQEALDLLPPEPRALLGEILHQVKVAVGRDVDIHFSRDMHGAKGTAYVQSGRIGVNLHWLNGIVQNWDTMKPAAQMDALMKATGLFGHEVTHVVHRYAEKSGLAINGVPVTDAIVRDVASMSPASRRYVAEQIVKAKGEKNASDRVLKYLSGDLDVVHKWYSQKRPGLSRADSEKLAAGEVMAEIGSIELVNRMNVQGLPQGFRDLVDRFKQVLINAVKWITGTNKNSEIAALQNLQSIAAKMYDHFGVADNPKLSAAFPTSGKWKLPPATNPFSSAAPVAPGAPGSPITVAPAVEVLNGPLLKSEMLRLGIRGAVGGTIGAFAGPAIAPNQVSTAEGIILGGIAGVFGVAIAKKMMHADFATEAAAALKAHPKNPLKALGHIMGGGKTLRQLGLEGRHGFTGVSSSMAKWVRWFERETDLHLDPAQRALSEQARGGGAEVIAVINDALDKVRWFKPSPSMVHAVGEYFEGRISKDDFAALLTSDPLKDYGNFIFAAREGMTTLSKMFADGLPKGAFKTHVIETSEKYLGKFYSAYTEGKFNMQHFDKAKSDLMAKFGYSDPIATELLHEYMREVQANRKMFSTGRRGESGEKYDSTTLKRRMATEEEIEGQGVIVGGLEHDKHSTAYLREKAKLDWMEKHKITDNWRAWLGEHTNPLERMIFTIQKIHPSAISGHMFDLLDTRLHSNGLKFSYTPKELVGIRANLESELASGKLKPEDIKLYQGRLEELSGYGPVPQGAGYGKLSGKWVDRFTRDSLNTYDSPYQWMEQPIIRSLAEFNNLLKIGKTALTPVTVLRNYLSMPVMGLIARTNWADGAAAFREIHFTKGDDYKLMLRRHIIGADYSTQELSKGPGTVFSGYMDSDIATKGAKEFMRLALKNYQQPDMLTRAGAFISARKRFAQDALENGVKELDPMTGKNLVDAAGNEVVTRFAALQDAMQHADTIDRAVNFTNRYTMNYSTVPNVVKAGRQLPFINMFISYTSEITRILKNLTEDVINPGPNSAGRMHALTTLSAMVAIPTVMVAGGKSMLSEKDRYDWDQVEKLSPHYNRSRFRVPYKRDEQKRFHYFDITNLLPADNWSQMVKAFAKGDSDAFWGANPLISLQNTPLLNMATEQITGEDVRTGQTVQGFGRVREILKEVLPPIIPPGYEGQRLIRAFSTNVEGELGLTNMRTGVQYRPSDIVANYMTGMRFGNVMLSTVQRQAISEAKQHIAEQQQLMRETTNMNAGPEQAARAQEIYNKSVEQIMLQLHSKMPPVSEQ